MSGWSVWLRNLQRLRARRKTAWLGFALLLVIHYWLAQLPIARPLQQGIEATHNRELALLDVAAASPLLSYRGADFDVRLTAAEFLPQTKSLLQNLGIAVPDAIAPIAWVSLTDSAARTVFELSRTQTQTQIQAQPQIQSQPESTNLKLRLLPTASNKVISLQLLASSPLALTLGTPLVTDQRAARKRLRIGAQVHNIPASLPLHLRVPAAASMRFALPAATPALQLSLGALPVAEQGAAGAAVHAIGLANVVEGEWLALACAAELNSILWRGKALLRQGGCPNTAASFQLTELELGVQNILARVSGSGWWWREGVVGEGVLKRVWANPLLRALIIISDTLVAGWFVLSLLPVAPKLLKQRIFLSYRRDDSAGHTGRLYDRLKDLLGAERIFMDIEGIAPGADFARVIEARIQAADVVLVVMGPAWLTAVNAAGERRLEQADDFVRMEIATALRHGKRVIPVLVAGASLPAVAALPQPLHALLQANAYVVSDAHFERDVDSLVERLALTSDLEPGVT